MENDPDLDLAASATVTELLEALQAGDVAKYRSLMSDSDQELMSQEELTEKQPVAPIDYTKDLMCPLLGLFGEEDQAPTLAQVDQHESALKAHGKTYEFHRYAGAGHGFFYYDRPPYRQEQAVDGWQKVFTFLETHLSA